MKPIEGHPLCSSVYTWYRYVCAWGEYASRCFPLSFSLSACLPVNTRDTSHPASQSLRLPVPKWAALAGQEEEDRLTKD